MTTLLTNNTCTLPKTTSTSNRNKSQSNFRSQVKVKADTEVHQQNQLEPEGGLASSRRHRFWYRYFTFPELETILTDFKIIFEQAPPARNWLEVLLCYPDLHALLIHRFAHWLYHQSVPVIPRLISH